MRHLIILVLTLSLLSCGTSKVVRDSEKDLKGNWTLNSFNYSKTGSFAVNLFNDTSTDCFEGSTWEFIPNNNSGTYEINSSDCVTGPRKFKFFIQEIDAATGLYDFMLKPVNAKGKSETNQGFRLRLNALSET
uniref:lipocalin family protein n=1 Tax=Bizionia echini TaxID=649333 RepID=UPI0030DC8F0C